MKEALADAILKAKDSNFDLSKTYIGMLLKLYIF
jgi:hypothetical protein